MTEWKDVIDKKVKLPHSIRYEMAELLGSDDKWYFNIYTSKGCECCAVKYLNNLLDLDNKTTTHSITEATLKQWNTPTDKNCTVYIYDFIFMLHFYSHNWGRESALAFFMLSTESVET